MNAAITVAACLISFGITAHTARAFVRVHRSMRRYRDLWRRQSDQLRRVTARVEAEQARAHELANRVTALKLELSAIKRGVTR